MSSLSTTKVAELGSTVLFTDRIVQRNKLTVSSSLLSEVNSCRAVYKSYIILAILGILALAGAVYLLMTVDGHDEKNMAYGVFFAGIVLLVVYFLTRRFAVIVFSGVGVIVQLAKGQNLAKALAFIEAIEQAKMQYEIDARAAALIAAGKTGPA